MPELFVDQWWERDRAMVLVEEYATGKEIACWWDDDVRGLMEDGFFRPGSHGVDAVSVVEYCAHVGLIGGA